MAGGLRLVVALCRPHNVISVALKWTILGLHTLSCRRSQGRHSKHAAVNDLLKRSRGLAMIPSVLEATDIARSDGRRPDGIAVMP